MALAPNPGVRHFESVFCDALCHTGNTATQHSRCLLPLDLIVLCGIGTLLIILLASNPVH